MPITAGIALFLLASFAAWTDIRRRRIPNALTGTGILLGLILSTQSAGLPGLARSVQGLAVAFAIYFVLYLLRAMAAGDVKLMAAIGSLTGPAEWLILLLFVCIAGGILALLLIAVRRRWRETLRNIGIALADLARFRVPGEKRPELDVHSGKGVSLPHAVAIAAGTYAFLWTRFSN